MRRLRPIGPALRSPVWFVLTLCLAAVLAGPAVRRAALRVEITAPQRGYAVAARTGCFACHGPEGAGGVPNPGSPDGEVPGFTGGVLMMFVRNEAELREYILDGAPARKRADAAWREATAAQLLSMPAYRGFLTAAEVGDLVAWLRVVSGLIVPEDPLAARGQDLAYRLNCFRCHGPMGAGGVPNPGSLKGYIPGWWGHDFRDLVRDDDELRAWIRDGGIGRLRAHPVASRFLARQRLAMPAYGDRLGPEELEALVRYVRWVHAGAWQTRPLDLES